MKIKKAFMLAMVLFSLFCICGCAGLGEFLKKVSGYSTKEIERSRENALKIICPRKKDLCYKMTKEILKEKGSYIHIDAPQKDMLVVFLSESDTTAVGIFFSSVDEETTQIEVASPSSFARDVIMQYLTPLATNAEGGKVEKDTQEH